MSRRLAALFVAVLLGLLVCVGLALSTLGWAAEAPYLVAVAVGLGVLVRRARALRAAARARAHAGRTCSCCTSTVYDPVEVR